MSNSILIILGILVVAFQIYNSLSSGMIRSFGKKYTISEDGAKFFRVLILQYSAELVAIVLAVFVLTMYVPGR